MVIQNLIVGIVLIAAVAFAGIVIYCMFSKPTDVRVVYDGKYYMISVKRHFYWDTLEDFDEVSEYYFNENFNYPCVTIEGANRIANEIKKNLKS